MLKKLLLLFLALTLAAPCAFAVPAPKNAKKKPSKSRIERTLPGKREVAQRQLDEFAAKHIQKLNKNLRPNKVHVALKREGLLYCAWYIEIDPATQKTELRETGNKAYPYMAHITYIEHVLSSYGNTSKEAFSGFFKETRTLRKRELARYDRGRWCF